MENYESTKHLDVAERIRALIFAGELAAGSFLDELVLCEKLGVSRTPLREALKVLAHEGLVKHEKRKGSFVSQITDADLDEIFPMLALLEGFATRTAVEKMTESDLAVLQTMHTHLAAYAQSGQIDKYFDTNYAIHEAFITLADNYWLSQTIADLRKLVKLSRLQQFHAPKRLHGSWAEHRDIFACVLAKDAQGAQ